MGIRLEFESENSELMFNEVKLPQLSEDEVYSQITSILTSKYGKPTQITSLRNVVDTIPNERDLVWKNGNILISQIIERSVIKAKNGRLKWGTKKTCNVVYIHLKVQKSEQSISNEIDAQKQKNGEIKIKQEQSIL